MQQAAEEEAKRSTRLQVRGPRWPGRLGWAGPVAEKH